MNYEVYPTYECCLLSVLFDGTTLYSFTPTTCNCIWFQISIPIAANTTENFILSFIGANPPHPPPIYNLYYTDIGIAISNVSLIQQTHRI